MLLEILILISLDLCHFLKTHTEFSSSFTPLEANLKARRPVRQRGIMRHTTEVNNTSRTESWISAHLHETVNMVEFFPISLTTLTEECDCCLLLVVLLGQIRHKMQPT